MLSVSIKTRVSFSLCKKARYDLAAWQRVLRTTVSPPHEGTDGLSSCLMEVQYQFPSMEQRRAGLSLD